MASLQPVYIHINVLYRLTPCPCCTSSSIITSLSLYGLTVTGKRTATIGTQPNSWRGFTTTGKYPLDIGTLELKGCISRLVKCRYDDKYEFDDLYD